MPSTLITIGERAFEGCVRLTNVEIPEGVTDIENYAFNNCILLETISLPSTLTALGQGAFMDCIRLNAVTIPQNLTEISDNTFSGCRNLRSVILHKALDLIGASAFENCTLLDEICFEGDRGAWEHIFVNVNGNDALEIATIHYEYPYPAP